MILDPAVPVPARRRRRGRRALAWLRVELWWALEQAAGRAWIRWCPDPVDGCWWIDWAPSLAYRCRKAAERARYEARTGRAL